MIHVAYHFEDWTQFAGIDTPSVFLLRFFHNLKLLGVNKVWLIDTSKFKIGKYYEHRDYEIDYGYAESLEEVEDAAKSLGLYRVYLEVPSAVSGITPVFIEDFVHPDNAIYIVGRDSHMIEVTPDRTGEDCFWVYLPSKVQGGYYAEAALYLALFHRLCKKG